MLTLHVAARSRTLPPPPRSAPAQANAWDLLAGRCCATAGACQAEQESASVAVAIRARSECANIVLVRVHREAACYPSPNAPATFRAVRAKRPTRVLFAPANTRSPELPGAAHARHSGTGLAPRSRSQLAASPRSTPLDPSPTPLAPFIPVYYKAHLDVKDVKKITPVRTILFSVFTKH